MAILINATRLSPDTGVLDKNIADAFGLGAGTVALPIGPAQADPAADGAEHYFATPLTSEREVVVLIRRLEDGSIEAFLSDYAGRLRAAVVVAADGTARKVSIFKAARKFQAELTHLAKEVGADLKSYLRYSPART